MSLTALGTDFTIAPPAIQFVPGDSSATPPMCRTVTAVEDLAAEGEERSEINIAPGAGFVVNGGVPGFSNFITLIIEDNDSKSIR